MKNLSPSTSAFLLEAPLDLLHHERVGWIEEVEFCKDEVAFFNKLLSKASDNKLAHQNTIKNQDIANHLTRLSSVTLPYLNEEIMQLEKFLSQRKGVIKDEEPSYRSQQRQLASKISDFEIEYKALKKSIFNIFNSNYSCLTNTSF